MFRHEYKHLISMGDYYAIRQRLQAICHQDAYCKEQGYYMIRSLYFDNMRDKALNEKLDGVNMREKFRLRYYNDDLSVIKLEKKSKLNGLCSKQSCTVTVEEVDMLLHARHRALQGSHNKLLTELYSKILTQGLYPKVIVDYKREAYVYSAGNVRITFDSHISSGVHVGDFLNATSKSVEVDRGQMVLEVKYDAYLPDMIRMAIQTGGNSATAYSKYAVCRLI